MGDINHRETFQYQILPIRKFMNSKNEVFFYALTIGFLCMILLYAFKAWIVENATIKIIKENIRSYAHVRDLAIWRSIDMLDSDFWMSIYNTHPNQGNDSKYLCHLVAYL
jgi:hypothetical protein